MADSTIAPITSTISAATTTAAATTSTANNSTGTNNTATGSAALDYNTGSNNTANGAQALYLNTTGIDDDATGFSALANNTTGFANAAGGAFALFNNTTGSYNTALGFAAGPDSSSTNLANSTAIGANAVVSESNALILGGTGTYAVKVGIGTATPSNVFTIAQGAGHAISDSWDTYSSRRWKTKHSDARRRALQSRAPARRFLRTQRRRQARDRRDRGRG